MEPSILAEIDPTSIGSVAGISALVIAVGKVAYDMYSKWSQTRAEDKARESVNEEKDDDRADRTNKETIKLLRLDVTRLVAKLEAREAELLACREVAAELRAENAAMRRKLERSGDKSL